MSKKFVPTSNSSTGLFIAGAILGAATTAYVGLKAAQCLSKMNVLGAIFPSQEVHKNNSNKKNSN
jgi:hypothetical protein